MTVSPGDVHNSGLWFAKTLPQGTHRLGVTNVKGQFALDYLHIHGQIVSASSSRTVLSSPVSPSSPSTHSFSTSTVVLPPVSPSGSTMSGSTSLFPNSTSMATTSSSMTTSLALSMSSASIATSMTPLPPSRPWRSPPPTPTQSGGSSVGLHLSVHGVAAIGIIIGIAIGAVALLCLAVLLVARWRQRRRDRARTPWSASVSDVGLEDEARGPLETKAPNLEQDMTRSSGFPALARWSGSVLHIVTAGGHIVTSPRSELATIGASANQNDNSRSERRTDRWSLTVDRGDPSNRRRSSTLAQHRLNASEVDANTLSSAASTEPPPSYTP
ncbi:hypothetical protein C8Q76DRAFT_743918 [Earliella scabrosa]|nr:hypothetical protein C8Q76DRAFT_743918 [Earliella scabrosa]